MKICIYYDSLTGNTKAIANAIASIAGHDLIYCGKPDEYMEADLYFIGSWTDKGNCSMPIQKLLQNLHSKKIAYFGTCGFGGSQDYYQSLYQRALSYVDASNRILGHFYCPGKMPESIRERYVTLLQAHPDDQKIQVSLKNFDEVKTRPDMQDLENAKNWAKEMIKEAL